MKKSNVFVFAASAIIAASAMSAAVYADDAAPAAEQSAAKLTRGVYAAHGENDAVVDYYIFDDETSGHTAKPDTGLGLPFSIEQNADGTAVFHFASPDDSTPAAVKERSDGSFDVTIAFGETESVTFRFELLADEDPDTFEAGSGSFLTEGVYAAYTMAEGEDKFNKLSTYFIFDSDTQGHTSAPILGTGLPFSVEQDSTTAVFHFAAADDNSEANISPIGDSEFIVEIKYDGSDDSVFYYFKKLEGADPETFSAESAYYGLFQSTDNGIELYGADREFSFLTANPAYEEIGLEINYVMPLENGFDIDFVFTTADNGSKTYNISYDGSIDNDTIFISLDDLLKGAQAAGDDITAFTVKNTGSGEICKLGFVGERNGSTKINIVEESVDSADDSETNPATGTDGLIGAGLLAAISGLTVIASRKRK